MFLLQESAKYTTSTEDGSAVIIPTHRVSHDEVIVWTPHPLIEIDTIRKSLQRHAHPVMAANLFGYKEDSEDEMMSLPNADLKEGLVDYIYGAISFYERTVY